MSDEFFALIMKVQFIYYYSSLQTMWILEKSILGVLGQKYLKFAIVRQTDDAGRTDVKVEIFM